MSQLKFSDVALEIEDLPVRAQALDDDAASDVLGGFSNAQRMRRRRMMMMRRAAMRRRGRPNRKMAKRPTRRRPKQDVRKKRAYMAKAQFHSRMASRFRRMAQG